MLPLWFGLALAGPEMIPLEAVEVLGKPSADVVLPRRDGGAFDLSAERGKPVVLTFWASWCGPCRGELPALSEYAATRPDVSFVAINVDRTQPAAERFLRGIAMGLPVAWDNEASVLGEFGVLSMPTSFVIDRQGVVRHRTIGYSAERGLTEMIGYIDEVSK